MAGLLHATLLMLTTLMVALNLSLSPLLVHTLQNDTEKFSVQKIGAPEALQYAISKYNENSNDLYQDVVVEVKDTKVQRKNCHFEVYVEQLENQTSLTSSKCNKMALHTATEAREADDAEPILEDPDVDLLSGTDCEDLEDFK
ncbi:Cystatin-S [Microtus ochrogaster]|uniref:Cystatin-S n=1 Tax=Microtus ochrogaster TaxID=79684 RepID=A0A8J6KV96_MICOH|nr:Cystatin-S [Microtus ochrogaster]